MDEEEMIPEGESFFLAGTDPVSVEGLKQALPPQDFETLTVGDERNAEHCLLAARLRCASDIRSTGCGYDEAVPETRLALMKLWLYELFAFVGQEEKAKDAYEDYTLIIKTSFGEIHTKGEADASGSGEAVAHVSAPKRRKLYGRDGC